MSKQLAQLHLVYKMSIAMVTLVGLAEKNMCTVRFVILRLFFNYIH